MKGASTLAIIGQDWAAGADQAHPIFWHSDNRCRPFVCRMSIRCVAGESPTRGDPPRGLTGYTQGTQAGTKR